MRRMARRAAERPMGRRKERDRHNGMKNTERDNRTTYTNKHQTETTTHQTEKEAQTHEYRHRHTSTGTDTDTHTQTETDTQTDTGTYTPHEAMRVRTGRGAWRARKTTTSDKESRDDKRRYESIWDPESMRPKVSRQCKRSGRRTKWDGAPCRVLCGTVKAHL